MPRKAQDLIAHQVLDKIDAHKVRKNPSRRSVDKVFTEFSQHIKTLVADNVKSINSEEYLISSCYGKRRLLRRKPEVDAFCRSNLVLFDRCFDDWLKDMRGSGTVITSKTALQYADVILPFVFDVKPIAEYLQRQRNPDYVFLRGHASNTPHTWEVFRVSRQLAIQSAFRKQSIHIDHKTAQIASVFVLRQALEAKFDRLIAIDFHDNKGRPPRLPHGFNHDFIISQMQYFDFKAVDFRLLEKIYEWCNDVVHNVYRPYPWLIDYAHKTCQGLFNSINHGPGQAWSINNGVEINNVDQMRKDYVDHFYANYTHGTFWCAHVDKPEALLI